MHERTAKQIANGVAFGSEYGGGMTAREYIATHALAGYLAWSPEGSNIQASPDKAAEYAVKVADALIAELAKPGS